MKIAHILAAAAFALATTSAPSQAMTVVQSVQGCFGSSSCSLGSKATDHSLTFSASSTPTLADLGTFTLKDSGLFNGHLFNDETFNLDVKFSSPNILAQVTADVSGFITVLGGIVSIDFEPETFTAGGNTYTFSVNDLLLDPSLFRRSDVETLTGSLTMAAAAPEPSTWAMMILGFVGLGFMAHRRKRNAVGVALAQ